MWELYRELCIDPESGLIFLHALTLLRMTSPDDYTDETLLNETLENYELYDQIDAKARLQLMSRRPFSAMFQEISQQRECGTYQSIFEGAMELQNSLFEEKIKLFSKTNYGEQFFTSEGQPLDLTTFLELFEKRFLSKHEEILKNLLKNGIITTTMIRNFREDIEIEGSDQGECVGDLFNVEANGFYKTLIASVDSPTERYKIQLEGNIGIQKEKLDTFLYDGLSPPWFLSLEDSMGRFKEEEMKKQDMSYGEAIVEIRMIFKVDKWLLSQMKLSEGLIGRFLKDYKDDLLAQVMCFFGFLESFNLDSEDTRERILNLIK